MNAYCSTKEWNELHLTGNNIIITHSQGCINGINKIKTLQWNLIILPSWRINDQTAKINDMIAMYLKNHKIPLMIMESKK